MNLSKNIYKIGFLQQLTFLIFFKAIECVPNMTAFVQNFTGLDIDFREFIIGRSIKLTVLVLNMPVVVLNVILLSSNQLE